VKISLTATYGEMSSGPVIYRGSMRDAFSLASYLGYDGVELHIRHPGQIKRDELKNLIEEYGLGIPTLGTGMAATQEGLTGNDPRQQPLRREAALECLEECTRAAAEARVTMLLEALNRYERDYLNTLEEALRVIRQIGMPNLKLLADTFHMNIEEANITANLRTAGRDLGHVHLADTNRQAPGHGHLDLRGVLRALQDIGYEGYLSFEILPLPTFARQRKMGSVT